MEHDPCVSYVLNFARLDDISMHLFTRALFIVPKKTHHTGTRKAPAMRERPDPGIRAGMNSFTTLNQ